MTANDDFDLFKDVPAFDNAKDQCAVGEWTSPPEPILTLQEMEDMPRALLIEHVLRLQKSYSRMEADVKFLYWEFLDYQSNLTYFSRAAKLAHKLNASDIDTIADIAINEIPQYFQCEYGMLYLYNLEQTRFELLRSSVPEADDEFGAGRAPFLSRLFTNHQYPFIVEFDDKGGVAEMDTGAVLGEALSASWRRVFGARALVFPMRIKQQDSLEPVILGGLVIGGAKDALEVRDAEISVLFCDLLSSSLNNAQLVRKLGDLTIIDPLTQIFNRRHLINQLGSAMTQARRQHHPLSVVMLDIDKFKRFNDTYGHIRGDEVLRNVASILKGGIRAGVDVPARYGGEEFVLVLPFTALDAAVEVSDRIRRQIRDRKVAFEGMELSVTCSFGVAEYNPGETIEKFIDRADSALYHAKKTGRDRVCAAARHAE